MTSETALRMILALGLVGGISGIGSAAPILSGQLTVTATMNIGADLGANSPYNPRSFGDKNYVVQIGNKGFARYPTGSGTKEAIASLSTGEVQMVAPFSGSNSQVYVLASGGNSSFYFSRFDYSNLGGRVFDNNSSNQPNSFDWIDNATILYTSLTSGKQKNLYKAVVTADPFTVIDNQTWSTPALVRIRNVRVGNVYSGYAYFGDSTNPNPGFWAINLDNGTCTQLGTLSGITGTSSWGLWTVKEVGGYLYVQTTDNGIWVYNMDNATHLGSLYTQYTKTELDNLTGLPGQQYWGFDVVDNGTRMLMSAGAGKVIEIGRLTAALNGTVNLLDYSGPVAGVSAAVELIQGGSTVWTRQVTLDNLSGFSVTGIIPGVYDVRIKPSHWLAGVTSGVSISGATNMRTVDVTNGDCDGDNVIGTADLSIIMNAIDSVKEDLNWDARADLDGDEMVTSTDLSIVLTSLGIPMISGTVQLADYSPGPEGMSMALEFHRTDQPDPVWTTNAAVDALGKFSVPNGLNPGTYDVTIKGVHWLRKLISGVTIGAGDVDVGTASLINGDADGDNEITSTDLAILLDAMDSANSQADLNGDGQVTETDLSIVLAGMDIQGD